MRSIRDRRRRAAPACTYRSAAQNLHPCRIRQNARRNNVRHSRNAAPSRVLQNNIPARKTADIFVISQAIPTRRTCTRMASGSGTTRVAMMCIIALTIHGLMDISLAVSDRSTAGV